MRYVRSCLVIVAIVIVAYGSMALAAWLIVRMLA